MKPNVLRIQGVTIDRAEASLSRYLPALDVQLFEFRAGMVLMPPHLLRALEIEYGRSEATAILADAGLVDGRVAEWRDVIEWGRLHGDVWDCRPAGSAGVAAFANEPDWHLAMCAVDKAWQTFGGPDRIEWEGVRIGQIDTGYSRHPVFGFPDAPWVDVASARTFVPDPPPANGTDTLTGPSGGHGTCSGSICVGRDADSTYRGVAPRAPIVPARINDCVIIDGRAAEFEAAARYLVDECGVGVINVSMGTFLKVRAPDEIVRGLDHCYERGVIVIGAAGNVPAPGWPAFPAALPRAIAVAGVTSDARPWAMSSYGAWVAFSAPAKNVRRAMVSRGATFGFTDSGGGTTFAAAMTSGAAALWLLAHSAILPKRYPEPWQRIEAFREMARRTAWIPPNWQRDKGFGAGILDVGALMDASRLPDASDLLRR